VGDDLIEQTQLRGFGGRHHARAPCQLQGLRNPDETRQKVAPAPIETEAEFVKYLADARQVRGEAIIAGERNLVTAASRRAVDGSYRWDFKIRQAIENLDKRVSQNDLNAKSQPGAVPSDKAATCAHGTIEISPYGKIYESAELSVEMAIVSATNEHGLHDAFLRFKGPAAVEAQVWQNWEGKKDGTYSDASNEPNLRLELRAGNQKIVSGSFIRIKIKQFESNVLNQQFAAIGLRVLLTIDDYKV